MAYTMIQKIIGSHSDEEPIPGSIVWMDLDIRSARDFAGASVVKNLETNYEGESQIADLAKTVFTFDCVVPANNLGYAENQQIIRDYARERDIKLYDVNAGIGSHILIDDGLAVPNSTVVGTDSHLNILGAIGSFGQGMGDQDIAFTFKAGRTWFEVPETIKVTIEGEMPDYCSPKDLTLAVVKRFGSKGALGKAVEFEGKAIDQLGLDGRITLASMVTEMGGIIGLIEPNDEVMDYCRTRSNNPDLEKVQADEGANYVDEVVIDISDLEPLISLPGHPEDVVTVRSLENQKISIDSTIIGSCTNGRWSDIKALADILEGNKIHSRVMMKVVAATREIYGKMLSEGTLQALYDAGAIVSHPGCGSCAQGQLGMIGTTEVQISTGNRNFRGKQGLGQNYLASPATAAVSSLAGYIKAVDY